MSFLNTSQDGDKAGGRRRLSEDVLFLTGCHRSGTTWLGNILTAGRENGLLHEPMNRQFGLTDVRHWYPYTETAGADYAVLCDRFMTGQAHYRRDSASHSVWIRVFKCLLGAQQMWRYRFVAATHPKRLVVKDPFVLLLSRYLGAAHGAKFGFIVRHPAAFVQSVDRMSWRAPLDDLLGQPEFVDTYNPELPALASKYASDPVGAAAVMWSALNKFLHVAASDSRFTSALVRHEDLCRQPKEEVRRLGRELGWPVGDDVLRYVEDTTSGDTVSVTDGRIHEFKRNSRALATAWKNVLDSAMVRKIRNITEPVSSLFYGDADW